MTKGIENKMNKEQFYNPGEEVVETDRLIMRRLRPEDYLAMAAWEQVGAFFMSFKEVENPE